MVVRRWQRLEDDGGDDDSRAQHEHTRSSTKHAVVLRNRRVQYRSDAVRIVLRNLKWNQIKFRAQVEGAKN